MGKKDQLVNKSQKEILHGWEKTTTWNEMHDEGSGQVRSGVLSWGVSGSVHHSTHQPASKCCCRCWLYTHTKKNFVFLPQLFFKVFTTGSILSVCVCVCVCVLKIWTLTSLFCFIFALGFPVHFLDDNLDIPHTSLQAPSLLVILMQLIVY